MQISILLLIVNFVATIFMVGLIWMVQIVHYPLFDGVGKENFIAYQNRHQHLITFVVGPAMLVEAISSVLLVWYLPSGISVWMVFTGFVLVVVIWISTATIQVPCHNKLLQGFSESVHRRLVKSNWIRTAAWTARGTLVICMIVHVMSANLRV